MSFHKKSIQHTNKQRRKPAQAVIAGCKHFFSWTGTGTLIPSSQIRSSCVGCLLSRNAHHLPRLPTTTEFIPRLHTSPYSYCPSPLSLAPINPQSDVYLASHCCSPAFNTHCTWHPLSLLFTQHTCIHRWTFSQQTSWHVGYQSFPPSLASNNHQRMKPSDFDVAMSPRSIVDDPDITHFRRETLHSSAKTSRSKSTLGNTTDCFVKENEGIDWTLRPNASATPPEALATLAIV